MLSLTATALFARTRGAKDKTPRKRNGKVYRAGRWWTPNQPTTPTVSGKKRAVLAAKRVGGKLKYKLLNFGAKGYGHNYSPEARRNYLKRSAGIKNKSGQSTATDKFSPNYWARKVLWSKTTRPTGTGRFKKRRQR